MASTEASTTGRPPAGSTSAATQSPAATCPATPSPAQSPSPSSPSPAALAARLDDVSIADAHRLRKRLSRIRRLPPGRRGRELTAFSERIDRAARHLELRRSVVPTITYPASLPVADRTDELARTIAAHQVVIVAGETGSGKSTQLPKVCLELGRGVRGLIGHTQPRRIAARTLAERIAEETETMVGGAIGYAIRFGDHTGPRTLVKLMTDGILLAEIASDPDLLAYDTIIIDEAHERSLNIDFLLGYLTRLLPRRPDLKLIITSATIDPEKFSAHFGGAPIVEVSGRTYPVEIRYRPYGPDSFDDTDDTENEAEADPDADPRPRAGSGQRRARPRPDDEGAGQVDAITDAVDELLREPPGDILIFLSGERDITDTADALRTHLKARGGIAGSIDVLPLYGRLSMAEQHRVFAPDGRRRIVLATNVAETSLTVPGIRYVIDTGTARISRYSARTKVQRLPIEKISRASAGQRAGRCGRVADGICLRLYSQEDFQARPEFTDPEIVRTSLASVILKMVAAGLGDITSFPFLDPPDGRQIADGVTVLTELGALARDGDNGPGSFRLTDIGRTIAQLPVDPKLARILVEADRRHCLADMTVIVAALAGRDVREFPLEERDKATAMHARFADATSDFVSFLSLWRYLRNQSKTLSGNGFRKMCRAEYLHFLRVREWFDLRAQLTSAAGALGMAIDDSATRPSEPDHHAAGATTTAAHGKSRQPTARQAGGKQTGGKQIAGTAPPKSGGPVRGSLAVTVDHEAIHTALATGLVTQIGARIEREVPSNARAARKRPGPREYQGTRGARFAIWPGSTLAKSGAPFVLAAELVETSRLWARTVAAVDPRWIEAVAGPLAKRQYSEPYWSGKRQAVMAHEKVMVLGVTLVADRTVAYDRIDPAVSRELMIRRGLVAGEMTLPLPFLDANMAALDEVAESERRARRLGIVIDDEALFALYDRRIPADVTSGRRLEAWWRKASRDDRTLLRFTPDMLVAAGASLAARDEFPDQIAAGGARLDLGYVFEPGAATDGVTATVPLAALASIDPASVPAQVPGLRRELALALIKSLPKGLRRAFVPAPDYADAALGRIGDDPGALPERLAAALTALAGVPVAESDFDYTKVPDHLRMRFSVVDARGREVLRGDDLAAMQRRLAPQARSAVARVATESERTGLTSFPAAPLPRETTGSVAGQAVTGYPAFVDEGATVGIRVFTSVADQERAMRRGTRRLVALALAGPIGQLASRMRSLAAARGPYAPGTRPALTQRDLLQLATAPHGSLDAVIVDAADAAIDALLDWAGGPARDAAAFAVLTDKVAGQLERAVADILAATATVLAAGGKAAEAIAALRAPGVDRQAVALAAELAAEHDAWLQPRFVTAVRAAHLPDVARYLTAIEIRASRAHEHPDRDRQRAAEIAEVERTWATKRAELRPERLGDEDVAAVRRLIAEYRIALFAQPMRTAVPVSAKRVRAAIAAVTD